MIWWYAYRDQDAKRHCFMKNKMWQGLKDRKQMLRRSLGLVMLSECLVEIVFKRKGNGGLYGLF